MNQQDSTTDARPCATFGDNAMSNLTTTERTAVLLSARALRRHPAGSPESNAAEDAHLALVAELIDAHVAEARDMFRLEAVAAVESLSAPLARLAS